MMEINELFMETIGMTRTEAIKYVKSTNKDLTAEYIAKKYDVWRYKFVRSYNSRSQRKQLIEIDKPAGANTTRKKTIYKNGKKHHVTQYLYKNEWYSLDELSELLKINRQTLNYNIKKKGLTIAEIVNKKPYKESYNYNGKEYTVAELAELAGVTSNTMHKRIKYQHMSIEQAVETKSKRRKRERKRVEYKGDMYTYEEFARYVGMSTDWVSRKLRKMSTYEFMEERGLE